MEDYKRELLMIRRLGAKDAEAVKTCERIIKEAQKLGDEEMEYEAKSTYMIVIAFSNEPEKMLACFPWLLSVRDKNPEKYDYSELLWYYKWVIDYIIKFSSISKERIMGIFGDMKSRYETAGYGLKTVLNYKRLIYQYLGEPILAEAAYSEWLQMEEDCDLSDCTACIINEEVEYLLWQGKYNLAIEKGQDLINRKYTCTEVPDITYSKLLLCYTFLGDFEKGIDFYKNCISTLNKEKAYLEDYGRVLTYLGLTQNFVKAKNVFIKQLPYALNNKCDYFIYEFYLGALVFLKSLELNGKTVISIPKEIKLNIRNENFKYAVSDVYKFVDESITLIINKFNKRNNNKFYTKKKEERLELLKLRRTVEV